MYTIKRAYSETSTGRECVVWWVMDGNFVTDAFDLRRDAKYWCDKWNSVNESNK